MTTHTEPAYLLGDLLKNVSRSFYLTLRVLPDGMREPVGLAYLLARAADTIADTALVAPERRATLLNGLRDEIERLGDGAALSRSLDDVTRMQADSHEHVLLGSMEPMLALLRAQPDADRAAIRKVVATLTSGMEFDLRTFPDEQSGQVASLPTRDALDRYVPGRRLRRRILDRHDGRAHAPRAAGTARTCARRASASARHCR
jgi:farnesyl-diphosphate farnesyltransferase